MFSCFKKEGYIYLKRYILVLILMLDVINIINFDFFFVSRVFVFYIIFLC